MLGLFYEHFPLMTLDMLFSETSKLNQEIAVRLSRGSESSYAESPIAQANIEAIIQWCNKSPDHRYTLMFRCYPIVQDTFSAPEPTPQIQELFKRCSDREQAIGIMGKRLRPNSWSGSRAEAWRKNLDLLNVFRQHGNDALNRKIDAVFREFDSQYEEMREDERQRDARENERFE